MTEIEIKESKEWLQDFIRAFGCNFDDLETRSFNEIVVYLEELQQYRAIGTVDELKAIKNDGGFTDDLLNMGYTKGIKDGYNKAIDEFAEKLNTDVESFVAEVDGVRADLLTLDYFSEFVFEVAEEMKGVQE